MRPFMKFNPGFRTDQEIIADFLVREADLEFLLETMRHNATAPANQHVLIVGPRGIGKTTLVLRAAAELRQPASELGALWYPVVFSEESYAVGTAGEFWLEALFHLSRQTGDARWRSAHGELLNERDDSRLRTRALAALLDFADEQRKRLVLVVENLQMLFTDQLSDDEAWALRSALQNEPRVMLLATATARFQQIENSQLALYDQFRVYDLRPLDDEDCLRFWNKVTGAELTRRRIRPIRILTGGNPRLLHVIAAFASHSSFRELMQDLTKLVDDHTDYFKSHLDELAPVERKVFVALAELWDPATAREVARIARTDVNKASAELSRLTGKGAVTAEERRRTRYYQVAERMYNIYYLMRRRGGPAERVKALVHFMLAFYEPDDLARLTSRFAEEARQLPQDEQRDHLVLLLELDRQTESQSLRKHLSTIAASWPRSEVVAEAQTAAPSGIDQLLARPASSQAEYEAFMESASEVVDGGCRDPRLECLARRALQSPHADARAHALLAFVLEECLSHYEEAEQALRACLALVPDEPLLWAGLGRLLGWRLGKHAQAEEALREAIRLSPDDPRHYELLAVELESGDKYAEAEEAYRRALDLGSEHAAVAGALAALLERRLERPQEAEGFYRKALEMDPGTAPAWRDLGRLLHYRFERLTDAEECYRRAVELDPNDTKSHLLLSALLDLTGRYEEAYATAQKAVELSPEDAWAQVGMAILLHRRFDRHEEAKVAYRRAIAADSGMRAAWANLVSLLALDLNRPKEADDLIAEYLPRSDRSPEVLNAFAWTFHRLGDKARFPEAEAWAREAATTDPSNAAYAHTLAFVLGDLGKWEEALPLLPVVLSDPKGLAEWMSDAIDLFVAAAAAGHAAQALAHLQASPSALQLEPLICALRLHLGETVSIAQEIMEVAQDILEEIARRGATA